MGREIIVPDTEIHTLREAMQNLTNAVNGLSIRFDERSKMIDKDLGSLKNDLWGTGDNNPGVKSKVQEHANALLLLKFLTGALATGVVGIIMKIFWNLIKAA